MSSAIAGHISRLTVQLTDELMKSTSLQGDINSNLARLGYEF